MPSHNRYFCTETVAVDPDGIPSAIVAVYKGEPLVLLVSPETMDIFDAIKEKLGTTHVELANQLRDSVCENGGQFHENAVAYKLNQFEMRSRSLSKRSAAHVS